MNTVLAYTADPLFVALVLIYFLFAFNRFKTAVLALPLFFPLYLFKIDLFNIPFTLVECFVYVTFLAFVFRTIWESTMKKRKKIFVEKIFAVLRWKFFPPLVLLLVAGIIGVLVSPEKLTMIDGVAQFFGRRVALGIFKGWIVAPLLLFTLFAVVVEKPRQLLTLMNLYTVSAVLLSLGGLFQVLTQSYLTPDARASGPFESANYMALYIAPAVLYTAIRLKDAIVSVADLKKYSFWKLPFRRGKAPIEHPENFFFIVSLLVLSMALLFTKSYAAMFAVVVAALFYFGLEYYQYHRQKVVRKFPWRMVTFVFGLVFAILFVVFTVDPSKWQSVFQFHERNSSSVRVEVYTISTRLIEEHWLTGIGLGQFPAFYQLQANRILGHAPYEWNMLHPHNLYLAMWLNLGFLGLVAFLWILYLLYGKELVTIGNFAFHKVYEFPKLRVIGMTLLLAVLVHGFLDTPFFKNDLALLFWLLVGLIALPVGKSEEM